MSDPAEGLPRNAMLLRGRNGSTGAMRIVPAHVHPSVA
jgi:hypothetical protein